MRTKTYVFEDIKRGMELIKEKHGPHALIVDVRTFGKNGSAGCEISVLVEEEKGELFFPPDTVRRKIEEVWETLSSAVNESFSNLERYLLLKRIEDYPLPLRTLFEKMKRNGLDPKIALDLISQVYKEAGDMIDSMTKAYFFTKNVIKRKVRLYEIKKDKSPVILFGPKEGGKTLTASKLSHIFRELGFSVCLISFLGREKKSIPDLLSIPDDAYPTTLFVHSEEEIIEKISLGSTKKIIVDCHFSECDRILERLGPMVEKILVLPASARDEKIVFYWERYKKFTSGVVFTKVDEEPCSGHILTHMLKTGLPVALLGNGEEAKDIVTPDEEKFFKILIEGSLWMVREGR